MECTVILPSDMKNDEKLPVLWLYHGSSGDNTVWLYHSPIAEYVDEGRFAAVLPNVQNSCFVNMNIGDKYESYVGKELFMFLQVIADTLPWFLCSILCCTCLSVRITKKYHSSLPLV